MKLDFSNKLKTADTLQMLQVSANALRHGSITEQGKEFLCLAVEDYIKLKNSQTGRPPIYETETARAAARKAQHNAANRKRAAAKREASSEVIIEKLKLCRK